MRKSSFVLVCTAIAEVALAKNITMNRFATLNLRKDLEDKSENWKDASLYEHFIKGSMVSGQTLSSVLIGCRKTTSQWKKSIR